MPHILQTQLRPACLCIFELGERQDISDCISFMDDQQRLPLEQKLQRWQGSRLFRNGKAHQEGGLHVAYELCIELVFKVITEIHVVFGVKIEIELACLLLFRSPSEVRAALLPQPEASSSSGGLSAFKVEDLTMRLMHERFLI